MVAPRVIVTIGGVALVGDVGLYKPFGEWPLDVTAFDGVGGVTTIQDFGRRIKRALGSLSTGTGPESPGLVSRATMISVLALMQTRGATQTLSDTLGNSGTIKPLTFSHLHSHAVPGSQGTLYGFELTWRWTAVTNQYGSSYGGL